LNRLSAFYGIIGLTVMNLVAASAGGARCWANAAAKQNKSLSPSGGWGEPAATYNKLKVLFPKLNKIYNLNY